MTPGSFTEEDYKKFGEFLNTVTEQMLTKNWSTKETVAYVRLLGHAQQVIAPKIYSNILEVEEVKKAAAKPKAKPASKSKASKK